MEYFTKFTEYGGATKSFFDLIIDVFYDTILPLNGFIICMFVLLKWKKTQMNEELKQGDLHYEGSFAQKYVNFSISTFIPLLLLLVFINTVLIKFMEIDLVQILF